MICVLAAAVWAQRGYRYRRGADEEDNPAPFPADGNEKTEFVFGRLRYQGGRGWGWGSWATDYPKADRQFLQGLRRLTRIHTRSVEQVVDIDSDEMFNVPWLYAVEVAYWRINDKQAKRVRDFLDRGGFLMVDDFHGTEQWELFMETLRKIYPESAVVDIEDKDHVFHIVYDLDQRFQVPGIHVVRSGRTYEQDGYEPRWRAVYDAKNRVSVAICHNMDLGDAWEWADYPAYPEQSASMAYRVAVNYILYSMTH